jgi:hypothetical protein
LASHRCFGKFHSMKKIKYVCALNVKWSYISASRDNVQMFNLCGSPCISLSPYGSSQVWHTVPCYVKVRGNWK